MVCDVTCILVMFGGEPTTGPGYGFSVFSVSGTFVQHQLNSYISFAE